MPAQVANASKPDTFVMEIGIAMMEVMKPTQLVERIVEELAFVVQVANVSPHPTDAIICTAQTVQMGVMSPLMDAERTVPI